MESLTDISTLILHGEVEAAIRSWMYCSSVRIIPRRPVPIIYGAMPTASKATGSRRSTTTVKPWTLTPTPLPILPIAW